MTQGKSRMRQFRMSGSVRGVAREGDSYRDNRSSPPPSSSPATRGRKEVGD